MAGGLLGSVLWNFGGVYLTPGETATTFGSMKQFTSQDDLTDYLEAQGMGWQYGPQGGGPDFMFRDIAVPEAADMAPDSATGANKGDDLDFSGTNVQVEGVDEADIVKTDGAFIYLVRSGEVVIIKAYPAEEAEVVSRISFNGTVQDMYVSGDKLVIFMVSDRLFYTDYPGIMEKSFQSDKTQISIYDISDRENPELDRRLAIDGWYFNSRLVGDYVYFIVTNSPYMEDGDVILPTLREGKAWHTVQAEEVWYPNYTRGWVNYHTVTSMNIQDTGADINTETFLLDAGTTLYVSMNNMYIVSGGWRGNSVITKIGIEEGGIRFKANGTVPGYVLNQFSMDEYKGYFRVATTGSDDWDRRAGSNVYVLDDLMNTVGVLEGLAPGEEIYSARFMGDRCYLVTFKIVDPLFAIDLSDPMYPTVLGKLKIPGFSNYLHPYDENILIGVGKETAEAKGGDFAWHQGIKISLFDVSDVTDPKELAKIEVGDRGSDSPALYNHHAFLFSKDRNLLVIPILEARIDKSDFSGEVPPDFYGELVNQGAYVFDVSPDGIELRGSVTHITDDSLLKSGFWYDSSYTVQRSLYIEDNLYTISEGMVKINNLNTLEEVASIELEE